MRGVNRIFLLGHLGHDPQIRYTAAGKPIAKFSLATGDSYKVGDEWKEETDWHQVVAFGNTAQAIADHLHKGSKVYVEGKLKHRSWKDKTHGDKRWAAEIVCQDVQFLDGKPASPVSSGRPVVHDGSQEGEAAAEAGFEDSIPF